MNDNRVENGLHGRVLDVLANSESAHIQEFRLYRELSREIEKKNDRLRYVDSGIYQRNQQRQHHQQDKRLSDPSSSTDIDQRGVAQVGSSSEAGAKTKPSPSAATTNRTLNPDDAERTSLRGELGAVFMDGNCQVCLIKGLRDDLTHVTKVIQEKNKQLALELRARNSKQMQ